MNILTWLLEFITGALIAIDYFWSISSSEEYHWMYWFFALDVVLCGVLVPCTYILKTDEVKELVYTIGWIKTVKFLSSAS